jgi:hypothetical protein
VVHTRHERERPRRCRPAVGCHRRARGPPVPASVVAPPLPSPTRQNAAPVTSPSLQPPLVHRPVIAPSRPRAIASSTRSWGGRDGAPSVPSSSCTTSRPSRTRARRRWRTSRGAATPTRSTRPRRCSAASTRPPCANGLTNILFPGKSHPFQNGGREWLIQPLTLSGLSSQQERPGVWPFSADLEGAKVLVPPSLRRLRLGFSPELQVIQIVD